MKRLVACVVAIEILIIALLAIHLTKRGQSITPLQKNKMHIGASGHLKYFYEFLPEQVVTEGAYFLEKPATYTINADALNETQNYTADKTPESLRIITLGDSFTMGAFVNTNENWPEVLEKLMRQKPQICPATKYFEVINLGMEGYDIEYSLERFKIRGQKYKPDLIMWLLMDNDFLDINDKTLAITTNSPAYKNFLLGTDEVYEKKLDTIWKDGYTKVVAENGLANIKAYQLEKLKSITEIYDGKVLFVADKDLPTDIKDEITNFVETDRRTHLFTLSSYDRFPDDHPSDKGHLQIAEALYNDFFSSTNWWCH